MFQQKSRDYRKFDIAVADVDTGKVENLISERMTRYIDMTSVRIINDEKEWIYHSQRDGWAHFYLYDNQGNLKNQITSGEFHCSRIVNIDEENRILYFLATGRENGEDPYYNHLYRSSPSFDQMYPAAKTVKIPITITYIASISTAPACDS